ncbi:30S ribosomal protein S2 [Candidatus Uhrbacteria bacterium]|nr:30S ribosomal protein S2 [Candidatus Uhrbacteria bacterium]
MPQMPSLVEMLQAGVHFGHQTSKWHPKMKKYLFGSRQGIHIINLEETQKALEIAFEFAKKTTLRGGTILFVGTKKQTATIAEEAAKACGMPYVTKRWLGGTLTNFSSMAALIRKFKDMKRRQEKGEYAKYTKFEQLKFSEQIEALDIQVGGIQELTRIPDVLFILDIRKDKTALEEGLKRGVKIIAVCDSNVNPTEIDYPIPANDDAVKSIEMIAKLMAAAIQEGREEWEQARIRLGSSLITPMAPGGVAGSIIDPDKPKSHVFLEGRN